MMAKPLRIGRARARLPSAKASEKAARALVRWSVMLAKLLVPGREMGQAEKCALDRIIADGVEIAAGLAVIGIERQVPLADILAVECRVMPSRPRL